MQTGSLRYQNRIQPRVCEHSYLIPYLGVIGIVGNRRVRERNMTTEYIWAMQDEHGRSSGHQAPGITQETTLNCTFCVF